MGIYYKIIKDYSALKQLSRKLLEEELIGIDTESDGLHSYAEKICLLQISTRKENYLIDTLSFEDLSPLDEVFRTNRTEKIFHAGEYDILCLHRDYGFCFNNLFDTMIGGKIIGAEKVGLSGILESELGVIISKKFQKADWSKRPISREMLEYAVTDTVHLINLRNSLRKKIESTGLIRLAEEEFKMLRNPLHITSTSLEDNFHKLSRKAPLNSRGKAILWKLIVMRDEEALRRDTPAFKVLSNNLLIKIASEQPKSRDVLSVFSGMGGYNMRKYSGRILSIINSREAEYPEEENRKTSSNEGFRCRMEKLIKWRSQTAKRAGLSSELIMPRQLMNEFADQPPRNFEELKKRMRDFPFRYDMYFSDWGFPLPELNG